LNGENREKAYLIGAQAAMSALEVGEDGLTPEKPVQAYPPRPNRLARGQENHAPHRFLRSLPIR
jgi:hypothetical protein